MLPIGPKSKAFAIPFQFATDAHLNLYPVVQPPIINSPTGAAYTKYTPSATLLEAVIRARVTSEDLIYAPIVTHRIADATTITSAAPTDDGSDRTRATEFKNDCNTHMASLTYHQVAGPAITAADATNDATLIALTQEIDLDLRTHAASTTQHGGRADAVFLAALVALALPATPTKGECRTYLADAALKAAWDAHRAVTDHLAGVQQYVTVAAGVPLPWPCTDSVFVKTSVAAGVSTITEFTSS